MAGRAIGRLFIGAALGLAAVAAPANAARTATADGLAAASSRSPVQISRRDRFRLTPATRVCVDATIDPTVVPRLEASGDRVSDMGLTFVLTERIGQRFTSLGLPPYLDSPERLRVNPYISHIADRSCLEQPGNVLVRLRVGPDAGGRGYRIGLSAAQGHRRYSSAIARARLITLSGRSRLMIAPDGETIAGLGTPFWDVTRDSHRLSTLLIDHIFAGNGL